MIITARALSVGKFLIELFQDLVFCHKQVFLDLLGLFLRLSVNDVETEKKMGKGPQEIDAVQSMRLAHGRRFASAFREELGEPCSQARLASGPLAVFNSAVRAQDDLP
jgi:hypothetical protein